MQSQRRDRGFTLIEVLVVITIVAILVGAVVLNLDLRNPAKSVKNSALRTGLLMELAADQAIYARQQFGIRFHPTSYEFYVLIADEGGSSSWQLFEDERLKFKPAVIELEFQVDISGVPVVLEDLDVEMAEATPEDPIKPHVMFLSNGEIMPDFRIVVADEEGEFRHAVEAGEVEPVIVEQLQ